MRSIFASLVVVLAFAACHDTVPPDPPQDPTSRGTHTTSGTWDTPNLGPAYSSDVRGQEQKFGDGGLMRE